MNPSEEIKSRLDIVEVIREYIQLKSGGANFQALCPFHREKTPSFMISPEKQIWHCFGCGKGGDVISFVMEIEGVSFVEALRILAPKAGVTLQKEDPKTTSQRGRLLDIMSIAVEYYHQNLLDAAEAKPARDYLYKRGLTEKTLGEWQLGYSPDSWNDIIELLKRKGYGEGDIFQAGLAIKKEGREAYYNRFRGRIMFPINEFNGNTVAFSARVRPDREESEKLGKYINSPQSPIYDKSRILFGLDKAKMTIRNAKFAVVVEGQMDVITAHQHGFRNVVASSGTALTEAQLSLLKRYTENLALAFDMDEAGKMAADRGIREAMKKEMNIKVVALPSGKDPDELIRSNPEEFKASLENASYIIDHYFRVLSEEVDPNSISGKREAVRRMLPVINGINNKIERDEWVRRLSEFVNTDERNIRELLSRSSSRDKEENSGEEKEYIASSLPARGRGEMLSETLLALLLRFPALLEYVVDRLGVDEIFGEEHKIFYKNLIIYYNNIDPDVSPAGLDFDSFKDFLGSSGKTVSSPDSQLKLLQRLAILGEKNFYELDAPDAKKETLKLVRELKRAYISERKNEVERLIARAEQEGEEERVKELLKELQILSEEYRGEE